MTTKTKICMVLLLLATSFLGDPANAQDEMFMYGMVYTVDDRTYEGAIRWGKEEVYWVDHFNAGKLRNENLRYLSDRDRSRLDEQQHREWFSWTDRAAKWVANHWDSHGNREYTHQFSCQFGDIRVLRPTGSQRAELEFHNSKKMEVTGEGYNDIGGDIHVMDKELGEVTVRWSRIDRIEFMKTPARLPAKFGEPLYGTVEAFGKKISGYIQWDHDERLTTDKLDGETRDGKLAIEFGKIRSIERSGNRSVVVLKSGRELVMGNTNDVARGHRGVFVMSPDYPAFDIPWTEFGKVTFTDKPDGLLNHEFPKPKELNGTVKTREGNTVRGTIVYDLDESFDFELLQGKEGEFEYTIPFRDIKKIKPKNENRAVITLKNGKSITLDDAQDVGERNQGLLVFSDGKSSSVYIPWSEVDEIEL